MKKRLILAMIVLSGCFACQVEKEKSVGDKNVTTLKELGSCFVDPPSEYGSAPLWVWNARVTHELIDNAMQDFKAKGFGGVFIHPRPGLITEYISDEWFELCRYTVEAGKKLDMYVWIYDENSYPSGFAGGHVPAQMPESYNQGKSLRSEKCELFPDTVPDVFLCFKKEGEGFRDVTAGMKDELGKKGLYYLVRKGYDGKSPWYGGFSYVDLLVPGVTEKFIEITLDAYKRALGEEFGKQVPGWFTDEPNINPPGGIRWTPDLFEVFEKRWGYSLKDNLPSLFEETGEWKRVRHNYTQTLLQLFIDRWAKPCFAYCEANNLKFTGHYWEHGWPNMADGGDNMAMYAWHQMPGIDMLFNQFNDESPQAQFGNIRSVKELASVANQTGYRRTLSETYGGGGWEESFRDLKRLGDWEYALGVNFMNQHLAHMTISGARKYDYPPSFSEHSPWWPYYRQLNLHYARLSMALSAGEQLNDILILEPTTSIWLYYAYHYSNPAYMETGKVFQRFITFLEKAQVEYDLGSENIIKDRGQVKGNRLIVGQRAYSKVIIPPMTENLDAPTFALLKAFAANGGTVLAYSQPSLVDGMPDKDISAFFSDPKNVSVPNPSVLPDGTPYFSELFHSEALSFTLGETTRNLYHHRRMMKDGQILFLANSSLTDSERGTVRLKGRDAIELHTLTGQITDYPETTADGGIEIAYDLPPAGSLLLYICNKKQSDYAQPEAAPLYTEVAAASPPVARPETANVLTIDFCDLTIDGESFRDMHVFNAADKAFKQHGFESGNPWNTSVQYKNSIVSRDTFTAGGFTASYRFTVSEAFDLSGIEAVIERPHFYEISINGHAVTLKAGAWWLDRETGVCPIGQYVKQGENVLTLKVSPMKILAEIEPVYIRGNFRVLPAVQGWELASPLETFATGSWKAQGWPFYSDAVAYTKRYDLSEVSGRYIVQAGEWKGTVATVSVNGKDAGILAFDPYSIDVSGLLKQGENTIVLKVIGSNKNLLGPFHNNPEKGIVGPWHFRNVKTYPPGQDYQQLDYGLMTDFTLKKAK
ncbi:MAG: hypothetical protein LBD27_06880 [Tannerella sp.]|jgi:hypothetical protein|nr:hypothetical protein [Tannerella sp.]